MARFFVYCLAMALLPSQANALFEIIRSEGLDPGEFRWEEHEWTRRRGRFWSLFVADTYTVSETVLTHPRGMFFAFVGARVTYFPDKGGKRKTRDATSWWRTLRAFKKWIRYAAPEILAPDLWSTVLENRSVFEAFEASDHRENSAFTPQEREAVSAQLGEIKAMLQERYDLTEEQLKEVETRLGYLEDAAARVGRIDWRHIYIATLIQIATDLAVKSEGLQHLLHFALAGLAHLFGSPPAQLTA